MENVRKHRDIKLVKTEVRRNYLVSKANYCTKIFYRRFISNGNERTNICKKNSLLGLSILENSKIVIYEFWYSCVGPKYKEKAKLCYLDTDGFIVHIKTKYINVDMARGTK